MLEKELYEKMFEASFTLPIMVEYWDETTGHYGGSGQPVIKIKIHQEIPIKEIYHNASLTLGEAYMEKKIEIEGSIEDLITNAYENAGSFLRDKHYRQWLPKLKKHTLRNSYHNVHEHYDIGNDFYALWLDPTLTYSCGYFETKDDSLETAQRNKVQHILAKLFLKPDETLLDIGCGWGTLILTAAENYGVKATGITLSQEQYQHVTSEIERRQLTNRCQVLLLDYRDLKNQTFDHITSVGMFEHVGKENLGLYFAKIETLLTPTGSALIHGISRQQGGATNAWLNKYIFPGGYVPGVAELVTAMTENQLQLIDLESLRRHYQLTLEAWTRNFHQVKAQVIAMEDEKFYRMWDLYLQACSASFKAGNIDVIQYLLVKEGNNCLPLQRSV